ncbi:MAG: hypothetical protein WCG98_07455 [bacterium]
MIDTFLKQEKYIGKKNKGKVSILSDEEKLVLDAQQALADSNQIARLYADIKSLFIPTQDVIHNLQMGYKIDTLLSSYHQDDVMRVIGEAAFCDMLLKRGTLFLDFSNTAGLKEIINSLTPYLDAMS